MTVNDRTVYGCKCCARETMGAGRERAAARRTIKRRERAAWKRAALRDW